ncbi:MAG: amidohydrolase family protein [Actinophytocola sp.]|nr:amidohydrolase family protein [Actinophytocola sp.]
MSEATAKTEERGRVPRPGEVPVTVVDCDVHPYPESPEMLREYLPEPWRSANIPTRRDIYLSPNQGQRRDARPDTGGHPGSDPALLERQLFEEAGVDYAILLPFGSVGSVPDYRHGAALATAYNDWQIDLWLGKWNGHGRYRGSIVVYEHDTEAAVREIERVAEHPGFVQVLVGTSSFEPFGKHRYHPIWEACARHGLPVAMHLNSALGAALPPTPCGYPSLFIEWHTLYCMNYMTQLVSMLCEGVFEKFPDLKMVFVEGGSAWLAPLMWRLDKDWRSVRWSVPWLKRPPSGYLRDHVRFTTQPIEEPADRRQLLTLFEMMDAEHILMFATDYPHWDFDDPGRALPPQLPAELRRRIMSENARELYSLPATRPSVSDLKPSEQPHRLS